MSSVTTTSTVSELATLEVTRTIPTGERPRGITFSKDYSVVYICASDSDTVQVMDPETGEILEHPSGWKLEILDGDEKRVTRLRLHKPVIEDDPEA